MSNQPKDGAPGTTDQWPRWEGAPESRPPGYLPAKDNPDVDRDAAGENLSDPDKRDLSDATAARGSSRDDRIRERAYEIWEKSGREHGSDEDHWHQARHEIEVEEGDTPQNAGAEDPALGRHSKNVENLDARRPKPINRKRFSPE